MGNGWLVGDMGRFSVCSPALVVGRDHSKTHALIADAAIWAAFDRPIVVCEGTRELSGPCRTVVGHD